MSPYICRTHPESRVLPSGTCMYYHPHLGASEDYGCDVARKAVILDMDGTLCDVSSIRYFVNERDPKFSGKKLWNRFHGGAIDCPPIPEAVHEYQQAKDYGFAILIVTARRDVWAMATLLWLKENGIEHDELYMRPRTDFRKDYEVKADILEHIREDGYEPVLAVDDNPAVIQLWHENDIPTVIIPGWEDMMENRS